MRLHMKPYRRRTSGYCWPLLVLELVTALSLFSPLVSATANGEFKFQMDSAPGRSLEEAEEFGAMALKRESAATGAMITQVLEEDEDVDGSASNNNNRRILATDRDTFLSLHNKARASVFSGSQLVWDEALARAAQEEVQRQARNCSVFNPKFAPYGGNAFVGFYLTANPFTPETTMTEWLSTQSGYNVRDNTCAPNVRCKIYTQIVWKNSRNLGCATATCNKFVNNGVVFNAVFSLCLYNPPGNIVGQRPFPNTGSSPSPSPPRVVRSPPLRAPSPPPPRRVPSSPPPPRRVPSSPPPPRRVPSPPPPPLRVPTSPSPPSPPLSVKAARWLSLHNRERRAVFSGSQMVWNATVAGFAQEWVNGLARACAGLRVSPRKLGENLFVGGVFAPDTVMNEWLKSKRFYNITSNTCSDPNNQRSCLSYTQIVWKRSTQLGCADASCPNGPNTYAMCYYFPSGNIGSQRPY